MTDHAGVRTDGPAPICSFAQRIYRRFEPVDINRISSTIHMSIIKHCTTFYD